MAVSKFDPNDLFGQMLTQWETLSNQMANNLMGTSQFGQGQGAAMAATLKLRETMHEQMTRFLEAANMPSREDITELREAVAKLDAKLVRIEGKLSASVRGPEDPDSQTPKGPPRTKVPSRQAKKAATHG